MPTAGNAGVFSGKPSEKINEVETFGYQWTAIRWESAGAATACVLVYNVVYEPIRDAVNSIVKLAGWKDSPKHSA